MASSAKNGKSVLIIVENLPVPRDRRVWQEAKALTAAGYTVTVICPATKACPERELYLDGIHILRHPMPKEAEGALGYLVEYSAALFWEFLLAWRVLLTRGFDVIHACNPPDTIFLVGGFFKLLGKRFVFDHHDLSPELYVAKFGKKGVFYKALCALERWTFKTADISIATNESFKRIAVERGGMDPARVHVVRSGPDLTRLKIQPPVPELKQGRRHLVGYMGVMNNQDGVDYVLHAARHMIHDLGRTDVHFALMGDGPELKNLRQLAHQLGVADWCTFTGWANEEVFVPMLNTADVCVCPDPWNEFNDKLTMNKIVEYMALGKPLVQFDLHEGRVSAEDAALYAARNDAQDMARCILRLLDDEALRARMGAIGRRRVEHALSWQCQVPCLIEAYAALDGALPGNQSRAPGGATVS